MAIKIKEKIGVCKDCGKTTAIFESGKSKGICSVCKTRKQNAKVRGKKYIPYVKLSEEEKRKIDMLQEAQNKTRNKKVMTEEVLTTEAETEEILVTETETESVNTSVDVEDVDSVNNITDTATTNFIQLLRDYGCDVPEDNLKEVLTVLESVNKLKDIIVPITKNSNQQAMLDLEQMLNVAERKLQHDWEYNNFSSEYDAKFKSFLTWRRTLKGAIFFWKKLYSTNTLLELQRAWNAYTQDPTEKVILSGEKTNSIQKRYQITTESISTIFNTRRPFTRVFYAKSEEEAYKAFVDWMSDRQLHEDKSKTTIVELKSEGSENVR